MPSAALYFAFGLYLFVVFVIAVVGWRQTHSHGDFILGGRKLGPYSAALSAGASDMSGWLLLGLPGLAFGIGLGASWLAGGLLLGTLLNWHWVAPKLRVASERLQSLTIPAYLKQRFNHQGRSLQTLSALIILVFFVFYTSSGLVAGGKLFENVFAIPYPVAVIIGTVVIVLYTLVGGFLAVSWSDVAQALLMLVALLLVPVLTFYNVQQQSNLMEYALTRSDLFYFSYDELGQPFTWIQIVSLCAWGLGYFGQPHILARFKAIKDPEALSRAKYCAVGWTLLTLLGAMATGIAGAMFFSGHLTDPETVFMALVDALFNPWIAGLLLAAILAAVMSTADSQLLVCSSALAEDLLKPGTGIGVQSTTVARISVVIISVVAMLLALNPDNSVLGLVSYAWAGLGAAFGPVILLSLHWPGITRQGALWGICSGAISVIIWKNLEGGIFELYELVPGFLVSTLAIIMVSYLTSHSSEGTAVNGKTS